MPIDIKTTVILIIMCILGTVIPRFFPFLIFPPDKPTPEKIVFLGKVLPFAITTMILVYCLKNIDVTIPPNGMPELLGIAGVVAIYLVFKNTLAAVVGGTAFYMILVQVVFV